ncbi:MAG: hypothetical protein LBF97_00690 [Elusimicrobiota bacterium]|jgi:hypothetical protein|nr:hypothetical protein [Elusimicrobiota bacterium]
MKRKIIYIEEEDDGSEFQKWPTIFPYKTYTNDIPFNPCERCSNNPKNNSAASGFCHCTLPYLYGPNRITFSC